MSVQKLTLFAGVGSLTLLIGALLFQHIGGFFPCKMCYWQRYPHLVAVMLAIIILITKFYWLALLGIFATLSTAGIGAFHAGVEQGWWKGPKSCTSGSINNLNIDQLLNQIMSTPIIRCDEIPWQMFGLSMAGWNTLFSIGLSLVWALSVRKKLA